ncbi:cytochrome P450 76M5-like [Aegilops tauschii subsp. strangulata]|uniref:cytochrome P450 76M5-like n=1 Tax=Aegilops tauschii subsp. strangulata TaxID=200361 RepID=UPI00098B6482|nr:cytochrome P450 76M5-like [Aegilops tauschii subsp. strangulata]
MFCRKAIVAATHILLPCSLATAQGARERAVHHMSDAFHRCARQEVEIGHVLYHGMFHLLTDTLFSLDGQDKLRDQERMITEADVVKLPYLQAAVKESMRLQPVAPLLLPHLVVEEGMEIGGYAVPKGAAIIFNSWSIMRDPATWERPEEFMPERFLGKTELGMWGKEVKFIPLGTGRRLCPALPMVELLVPFMVASMLHALEWRLPHGMPPDQVDVTERYTSNDILLMDVPLKVVPMVAT